MVEDVIEEGPKRWGWRCRAMRCGRSRTREETWSRIDLTSSDITLSRRSAGGDPV
jgi:hypothetical protein